MWAVQQVVDIAHAIFCNLTRFLGIASLARGISPGRSTHSPTQAKAPQGALFPFDAKTKRHQVTRLPKV